MMFLNHFNKRINGLMVVLMVMMAKYINLSRIIFKWPYKTILVSKWVYGVNLCITESTPQVLRDFQQYF